MHFLKKYGREYRRNHQHFQWNYGLHWLCQDTQINRKKLDSVQVFAMLGILTFRSALSYLFRFDAAHGSKSFLQIFGVSKWNLIIIVIARKLEGSSTPSTGSLKLLSWSTEECIPENSVGGVPSKKIQIEIAILNIKNMERYLEKIDQWNSLGCYCLKIIMRRVLALFSSM